MTAPYTAPYIDTDTMESAFQSAAAELEARFVEEYGEHYRVEDLQAALTRWFELSLESLIEDVLFHTVDGDRAYAFNRRAFEIQLKKLQPVELQSRQPVATAA
jgi:hypothetical protein